ncbi:MAG: S8 family peptidase [Planctomycetota bacterium]|nr:S8 family peptidase [Planctomycetota bacterium]
MTLRMFSLAAVALAMPLQAIPQTPEMAAPSEGLSAQSNLDLAQSQVIVRFQANLDRAGIQTLLGPDFRLGPLLYRSLNIRLVYIQPTLNVESVLLDLQSRAGVIYAQEDHPVQSRQTTPNDPSFSGMYGLNNTGQGGGTPDADIDAPEAWDLSTGSSDVVIAIVDGGADSTHPDLLPNRWENSAEMNGANGVDDDGNGYVDDRFGWNAYSNNGSVPSSTHGTHVAGTAGARGNNRLGVVGVNWNSKLMHIAGSSSQTSTVLIAYGYARDQKGLWLSSGGTQGANVVVTNSSFGIDNANCASGSYPAWDDAYDDMGAVGILSCAATANAPTNVDVQGDVPTGCSSDWLVTVTATDRNDQRTFSGYGQNTIDLAAPGVGILSTVPNGGYSNLTGTSMATPHVAGAVAFLHSVAPPALQAQFQANPGLAALTLKEILIDSVDALPALSNETVSGGRLNLHQSALAVLALDGLGATSYCFSLVNSSGSPAQIQATGDAEVAANDLTLTAIQMPLNQFGYFLASKGQDAVVFAGGSQGVLCVGGGMPIGRLNAQIRNSGATGEFEVPVDLTSIPVLPAAPVVAGETWNFQGWFRDQDPTSTSNFTNGVSITFY